MLRPWHLILIFNLGMVPVYDWNFSIDIWTPCHCHVSTPPLRARIRVGRTHVAGWSWCDHCCILPTDTTRAPCCRGECSVGQGLGCRERGRAWSAFWGHVRVDGDLVGETDQVVVDMVPGGAVTSQGLVEGPQHLHGHQSHLSVVGHRQLIIKCQGQCLRL